MPQALRGRPTTILDAAVTDSRSESYSLRNIAGAGANEAVDLCVTVRGTLGTATCSVDVSHDNVHWIPTGEVLAADNEACIVTLGAGMYLSVNYVSGGGSAVTVEVS